MGVIVQFTFGIGVEVKSNNYQIIPDAQRPCLLEFLENYLTL